MNRTYIYTHFRPAVTVDCVVFGIDKTDIKVLLIERGMAPFLGKWALPGGFIRENENPDDAVLRELNEEAGLDNVYFEQLKAYGSPGRDPRTHVITIAYYTLTNISNHSLKASTDAKNAKWYRLSTLKDFDLAFDHKQIIKDAHDRILQQIWAKPICFNLLPKKFTFREVQALYEKIQRQKLDKRNFRRKMIKTGFLTQLDEKERNVSHRAATLYSFSNEKSNWSPYRANLKKI